MEILLLKRCDLDLVINKGLHLISDLHTILVGANLQHILLISENLKVIT